LTTENHLSRLKPDLETSDLSRSRRDQFRAISGAARNAWWQEQ
jgi:hypothetical protein